MSAINPEIFYTDPATNSYIYVSLENIVDDFIDTFCGNGTLIGKANRRKIVRHAKQGIKQFTINALRETKKVELELGDTLDITLPPDYVNWVRVSYVNPITGDLMFLSVNDDLPAGTAYLQDHDAAILFDDEGFILEGTTYHSSLKDTITERNFVSSFDVNSEETNYNLDTTKNINGAFKPIPREGRMHFSSDNASRVIMLEYVSDGLEFLNESDIKVSKLAETAILHYINFNMMFSDSGIPMYEKKQAEKIYRAEYTNAKIRMMDVRIGDTMLVLNAKRQYLR